MSSKRFVVISSLAFLTIVTVSVLDLARPYVYVRLCNLYRDALNRGGRTTSANSNLVFLAIDAASVNLDESDIEDLFDLSAEDTRAARALHLMSNRFPWSREVYALILERLVQARARVVVFDLMFPGPSDDDAVFRAALDRYAEHVVISSNFVDGSLTRPSDTLIPQTSPIDSRVGFANFWADDDEVVRRARYHVTFEQIREAAARPNSERFSSLAAVTLTKAGFARDIPADMDDHALRFTDLPRQGFPSHSLFEIFVPAYWKNNYQSGEFFRDKIVIIGAEGNWQHDDHPTPMGNMPGAEVHLNAMNAALHHEFLRELSPAARVICCIGAGLVAVLLSLAVPLPWLRFGLAGVATLIAVGVGLVFFNRLSLFLPIIAPVSALNTTVLLGLIYDFTSEHLEKARLRRTFERYVSRDVVREMIDHPQAYGESLGGVVRPAAILFSDIRAYSRVVAQTTPQALITQLNEYFTAMVECVFQCGGTLDKFIGDALMAVWGTLHTQGAQQDAISAVRAALLMRDKLAKLNVIWRERGWPELRVGTGVNYGEVVAGNIGSPQRMEFTVIGDAVNFSWRLQELTKKHDTNIILSSSVALLVADHFKLRPLGDGSGSVREAYQIYELEPDSGPASPLPYDLPGKSVLASSPKDSAVIVN